MKFMLFTYRDPSVQLDQGQRAAIPAAVEAWCTEMDARLMRRRYGFATASWS